MQPQFTEKARTALLLAEKTASALRQGYVGTEHMLAWLFPQGDEGIGGGSPSGRAF